MPSRFPVMRCPSIQVGDQQDEEERGKERQAADPFLQRIPDQPAEQAMDREVHDQQRQSDQQMIHDEMREVSLPARPKDRLIAMQGRHLLDQDEDQTRTEQVEDEPVEADIGCVVGEVGYRNTMAAHRRGDQDQSQCRAVQPAIAALDQIGDRHAARDHHADQQHVPQQADVVLLSQVRCGQIFGEMERQHGQHREPTQRERDDAGDLALAHLQGAGLVEDRRGLPDDRWWLHGR